ncbi:hypothetical protein Tco_1456910 [Tanacetum coccineum]
MALQERASLRAKMWVVDAQHSLRIISQSQIPREELGDEINGDDGYYWRFGSKAVDVGPFFTGTNCAGVMASGAERSSDRSSEGSDSDLESEEVFPGEAGE